MKKKKSQEEIKKYLYETIFGTETPSGKMFDVILMVAIVASVLFSIFESFISTIWMKDTMIGIEIFFTVFFTIEYVLRIYCAPHPRKYVLSFYGIIDLMSILPVYLAIIIPDAHYWLVLRSFRLIRVFRVFKLFSFLNEGNLLMKSVARSFDKIMVFFLFVFILNICLGTIMFMIEGDDNHELFCDIPHGIYWSIVTMTTVGYGDMVPITGLGRFVASCVMLFGYTIIAVPTGIVTASIATETAKENEKRESHGKRKCFRCGYIESDLNAKFCRRCGAELDEPEVDSMYR